MANLRRLREQRGGRDLLENIISNVGNHSGKLIELIYMNHTSVLKTKKAINSVYQKIN